MSSKGQIQYKQNIYQNKEQIFTTEKFMMS